MYEYFLDITARCPVAVCCDNRIMVMARHTGQGVAYLVESRCVGPVPDVYSSGERALAPGVYLCNIIIV